MGFFTAEILRILNMVLKVVSQTYCLQNFFFFFSHKESVNIFFPQRICELLWEIVLFYSFLSALTPFFPASYIPFLVFYLEYIVQ